MTFLERKISDAVMRGTRGGPRGRRSKAYVQSGRLKQAFEFSRPLHGYDLSYGIRTLEDFEEIRALFYVVMFTPFEGFRARDWNDYKLTQANSTLSLITGAQYQVNRVYTAGASSYLRPIFKISNDAADPTPVVYRTRASVVSVATATVDVNTGIVTMTGHLSGDTYTIEARFDVPVTFADDSLDSVGWEGSLDQVLQELGSIKLEELRL